MAGIDKWRLSDEVRTKIELFQKEANNVLPAHFLVKETKTLPQDVLPPEPAVVAAGAVGNALLATIDVIVRQGNEFVTEATNRTMAIVRDVFVRHLALAADHGEVKTRVTAAEVVAACGDQMT